MQFLVSLKLYIYIEEFRDNMPNKFSIENNKSQYICVPDRIQAHKPAIYDIPKQKIYAYRQKDFTVVSSGGISYDLKELIMNKLNSMIGRVFTGLEESIPVLDWCKKNLIHGTTADDVMQKILRLYDKAETTPDKESLFEAATGKKYTQENLDKFIKGEIELSLDYDYKMYTGKSAPKVPSAPLVSKTYQEDKDKQKSEGKEFKLSPKQQVKYNIVYNGLSVEYQKKLSKILSYGKLTEDKSQKLTVLDSLHKIFTTQRFKGLDNIKLVQECIDILENPNIITQLAEDIPEEYLKEATGRYYAAVDKCELEIQASVWVQKHREFTSPKTDEMNAPTTKDKVNYIRDRLRHRGVVSTCAAASLEYDLVTTQPAEFFRIVELLTSPGNGVVKFKTPGNTNRITLETAPKLPNNEPVSQNGVAKVMPLSPEAVQLTPESVVPLNMNNLEHMFKFPKIEKRAELKADIEAYNLAQIQNNHKDKNERSMIDILMQSMIMNIGSDGEYNSLTDLRVCNEKFILEKSGLYNDEIQNTKTLLFKRSGELNTYGYPLENGNMIHLMSKSDIKDDLLEHIKRGENIIMGFNQLKYGHEITIIGYTTNDNGKGFFICQDSCQEDGHPATYCEDFILSNIDHAIYVKDDKPLPPPSIRKNSRKELPGNSFLQSIQYVPPAGKEDFAKDNTITVPWSDFKLKINQ